LFFILDVKPDQWLEKTNKVRLLSASAAGSGRSIAGTVVKTTTQTALIAPRLWAECTTQCLLFSFEMSFTTHACDAWESPSWKSDLLFFSAER